MTAFAGGNTTDGRRNHRPSQESEPQTQSSGPTLASSPCYRLPQRSLLACRRGGALSALDWGTATPAAHAERMCSLSHAALQELRESGRVPEPKSFPVLGQFRPLVEQADQNDPETVS